MNKSQIAKALKEAVFTPGKLGPMKVIVDVGDVNYYIRRATEFLTLSLTALTRDQRVMYLDSALGLIAVAKVKTQDEMEKILILPSKSTIPILTMTKAETKETAFTSLVNSIVEPKEKNKEIIVASNTDCSKYKVTTKPVDKDEVDKSDKGREVRCAGDSVQKKPVSGSILDVSRSSEI